MSVLLIVSASLTKLPPEAAQRHLQAVFDARPAATDAVALHPAGMALDAGRFTQCVPYETAIGLEHHPALWRPLRERRFAEIVVVGIDAPSSPEEIVLACYLEADHKVFVGHDGRTHDLAAWQQAIRPDFAPRPARLQRFGYDEQRAYVQTVHRALAQTLAHFEYDAPRPSEERAPETLIYRMRTLAGDLADQTAALRPGMLGRPFTDLMCMDGTLVRTSDYYRALANFVTAIAGMQTVLDVGCGSGFLACHLAGSGRYADVLGVDASPERIAGARLHGELNRSAARFDVMSMADLQLPDQSVDLSVTSYSLEQSGPHLARCFAEIRRVTRRMIILFEPAIEFFPTLTSLWHVPQQGWATDFHATLVKSGLSYAVRPLLLYHYYNCGAAFVIDLESREHPRLRFPHLFGIDADSWPGGVEIR